MKQILDNLDEFFASQKENEQKVFFFLPILLIGFLVYYFVYPITDENLTQALKQEKKLNKKIKKTISSNNKLKTENGRLQAKLKKANKVLKNLNKEKAEIENLIKKLSFLKFDIVKWASFYNNIPSLATKYHLTIVQLDNYMFEEKKPKKNVVKKVLNKKKKRKKKKKKKNKKPIVKKIQIADLVQKRMEIKIDSVGDFVEFLKFINEFETKKELIKVKALKIEPNKMSLTLEIYGAKL